MKSLILHIGRHKTGTSSLQKSLHVNRKLLAERGFLYPFTARKYGNGHHHLSEMLRNRNKKELQRIQVELALEAKTFDSVIMSSEDFQNLKDWKILENFFADYRITTVCYLREFVGYVSSAFMQHIQATENAIDFIAYANRYLVNLDAFEAQWRHLSQQSYFRLYQRDRLKNNDIIADFYDILGIDSAILEPPGTVTNPSISGNLLALKMLMNQTGQSKTISYSQLGEATLLSPRFRGKIFVSADKVSFLRERNPYNRFLKMRFGDIDEPSFEEGNVLFDKRYWRDDMQLLADNGYLDKLIADPIFSHILAASPQLVA